MTSQTVSFSRYPVPELRNLDPDIRHMLEEIQEKTGFIPNVFMVLAHRPDELRAFVAYHDALMKRESGLSKAEREMIVIATSAENSCLYCIISHGAILRIYSKHPTLSDQITANYRKADLTDRQKAMLDFAVKICNRSAEVGDEDFAELHAHGFSDEDIWDIGAITALFALSNRMANLTSMLPNDEFYNMARDVTPRDRGA
tara:strand:+ start:63 stop:665 length:603 start_codon:yes stop_codon:yes gene_type:complete